MPPLLPGKTKTSWLANGLKIAGATIATVWLITILPYILLFSLILALLLIPTLRRLRSELEQTINIEPTPLTDITPWHQKLIKKFNNWRVK
ncbi:MAG: hypothetical protein EBU51_04465 [Synechococcaceae bacterium WB6_3A_227]|nr:hypothetical protein [Synechococcaceae bacterium WB6_3A_227]